MTEGNKMVKVIISKLKKDAWIIFSIYIRLKESDKNGWGKCCTCKKPIFWKRAQAGHFISGRHNIILFDERGVHTQCCSCNLFLKGNSREYDAFMRKKYGNSVVKELDNLGKYKGNISKQFTAEELKNVIENCKNKISKLYNGQYKDFIEKRVKQLKSYQLLIT